MAEILKIVRCVNNGPLGGGISTVGVLTIGNFYKVIKEINTDSQYGKQYKLEGYSGFAPFAIRFEDVTEYPTEKVVNIDTIFEEKVKLLQNELHNQ